MLTIPGLKGQLHDATLQTIACDWVERLVALTLRTARGNVTLRAEQFTSLVVPHEMPWGPSVSVNEVRLEELAGSGVRLELEMQSGDTLIVEAGAVAADE